MTVRSTTDGSIVTITLDRPERSNSLVPELLEELLSELDAAIRPDIDVVVLTGAGPRFSTGGDVSAFWDHRGDLAPYARRVVGLLNDAILAIVDSPAPVVAAVEGMVTGGSLGLVAACDLVVAGRSTTFAPWYPVVGFSPDGGWTAIAPAIVGAKRAARSLFTNEHFDAVAAGSWGLVTHVVPDGEALVSATETARSIAAMRPGSIRRAKRLLAANHPNLAGALERELDSFVAQIVTEEALHGMAEFLGITP